MCWCNPSIRTPQCRSINCVPPKTEGDMKIPDKIKITPLNKFKVEIGGVEVGEFSKGSSWNGMVELKNDAGSTIIANDNETEFEKVFTGIFSPQKESGYLDIVKISPSLIPLSKDKDLKGES